ncbi:CHAT domain-containing protein [Mycena pura]|uniref:CHAT domain-containing protein n=1 Tax=Mycena pura TaxID=153505 RepID=A0AAD6YBY0_9AGAR|nr:CHAT domain-containing protein [Mycena pura]
MLTEFLRAIDPGTLKNAIALYQETLALQPVSQRRKSLLELSEALLMLFHRTGDMTHTREAVAFLTESLSKCSPSHPNYVGFLNNLANEVRRRHQQKKDFKDLEEAITLYREALAFVPASDANHGLVLSNLANGIDTRYQQRRDLRDLEESIKLYRDALAFFPAPNPSRDVALYNLGCGVKSRYEQKGDFKDLEEAIELHREALTLRHAPHPGRKSSLTNLANGLQTRYQQKGDFKDLKEAIKIHREALALCPFPDPDRGKYLGNIANGVIAQYLHKGDFKDLEDAIKLYREALALCPAPHPDHAMSLNNLANGLENRYQQKGDLNDLEEAITLNREALALRPGLHPDRSSSLNNLANVVQTRYEHKGDLKDLEEAIKLNREALTLRPGLHPDRSSSLNHLANGVRARHHQKGNFKDLEEAIKLYREALTLLPALNPIRGGILDNLANGLQIQYRHKRDLKDLDEAVKLHREALVLFPAPHPYHSTTVNNLGNAMLARYEQKVDPKDLEEAIRLFREALALFPAPHTDRGQPLMTLGNGVLARYQQQRDFKDLEEAIKLYREAVAFYSVPHPNRGQSLAHLGLSLALKYNHTKDDHDLINAISTLQGSSTYPYSSPLNRLTYTRFWAQVAANHEHSSAISAYRAMIDLLPQIAALDLDIISRQEILTQLEGSQLASDAASCAIKLGEYSAAVEMLEASRSIFWSQALHLRTPLHHLQTVEPQLALKLKQLATELELTSFRDSTRDFETDNQRKVISMEAVGVHCRQLNEEWETTVESVRMLPGFEDFMRHKNITALQQAAVSGPVIILTASRATSSALIVSFSGNVQNVWLPDMSLPVAVICATLAQALSHSGFTLRSFLTSNRTEGSPSEPVTRLFGLQEDNLDLNPDDVFRCLLVLLWETIVKPVFDALNLQASNLSATPPRVWWCPTGPFTFLPIHAAGIYGHQETDCVSDYVVSSYTPTVTALLDPPAHCTDFFKMTAVIQPDAPGCSPLPGTQAELQNIKARVPNSWLTALDNTTKVTIKTVVQHLQNSSIVHFACHGIQDPSHPLDSGLALSDGRLKVSQIMRGLETNSPEEFSKTMSLAFLSACETAKGDSDTPDESMHLAATLLFAGFRSAVATMW